MSVSCDSYYKKFLDSLEHLSTTREKYEDLSYEDAKNDHSVEEAANEVITIYGELASFVNQNDPDGIQCEVRELQKEISNLANSVDAVYHLTSTPNSCYDKAVKKALFPISRIKEMIAKAKSLHGRVCKVESCNPFLRCYGIKGFFTSYDKTKVAPFANPMDAFGCHAMKKNPLSPSFAAGYIEPNGSTIVHVHPHVTQTVFVQSGVIKIREKYLDDTQKTYACIAQALHETTPKTIFQIVNTSSSEPARLIYVVYPAYVFVSENASALGSYNDSVDVATTWEEVEEKHITYADVYARHKTMIDSRQFFVDMIMKREEK